VPKIKKEFCSAGPAEKADCMVQKNSHLAGLSHRQADAGIKPGKLFRGKYFLLDLNYFLFRDELKIVLNR